MRTRYLLKSLVRVRSPTVSQDRPLFVYLDPVTATLPGVHNHIPLPRILTHQHILLWIHPVRCLELCFFFCFVFFLALLGCSHFPDWSIKIIIITTSHSSGPMWLKTWAQSQERARGGWQWALNPADTTLSPWKTKTCLSLNTAEGNTPSPKSACE